MSKQSLYGDARVRVEPCAPSSVRQGKPPRAGLPGAETQGVYAFEISENETLTELLMESNSASTDTCRYSFEPPLPPVRVEPVRISLESLPNKQP